MVSFLSRQHHLSLFRSVPKTRAVLVHTFYHIVRKVGYQRHNVTTVWRKRQKSAGQGNHGRGQKILIRRVNHAHFIWTISSSGTWIFRTLPTPFLVERTKTWFLF